MKIDTEDKMRITVVHLTGDPLIDQARAIADAAHWGQKDKGGKPVIEHVTYVAQRFDAKTQPKHMAVAYMHDTLEDSPLTTCNTLRLMFGDEIANAVLAITRLPGEKYFDYIARCKLNAIARVVKIEDLKHNMQRHRWPDMPDGYYKREQKALEVLEESK